ncbi:hypothetical protein BJ742DRAFT_796023 [Cladochytrium replicatum]|nr:hypothetical protein BJ742DRAFT_796023 [Cladochytrium replicatum]
MPIDYSKWDRLELSDDEDFDCIPQVDKASMIRWRQAQTHLVRRERKDKIAALKLEVDKVNNPLIATLSTTNSESLFTSLDTIASSFALVQKNIQSEVDQFRIVDRSPYWEPPQPIPMVEERIDVEKLLAPLRLAGNNGEKELAVKNAIEIIEKRNEAIAQDIAKEEAEANKKITSENMFHETSNKTVITKQTTTPLPELTESEKPKKKKTATIETIHTPSASAAAEPSATTTEPTADDADEDEDEQMITYEPAAQFGRLTSLESSRSFIGKHPEIVTEKFSDEILTQAFTVQMDAAKAGLNTKEGKRLSKEARNYVTQSLLLQYCKVLGKDGVSLFFKRMENPQHAARVNFYDDVEKTYTRIRDRTRELQKQKDEEEAAEKRAVEERVKVATQEDGSYALPLSDDPTDLEKERARVFAEFPKEFQYAILTQDVEEINKVLATLEKDTAEFWLQECDRVGLISLQEEGTEEE